LSNLWLGDDFKLKIVNFESAFKKSDEVVFTKGAKDYRAPEIRTRTCTLPEPADLYSAGIILFVMKTSTFPYLEDRTKDESYKLYELLTEGNETFWKNHEHYYDKSEDEDASFKDLFFSMVKSDPTKRATIEEIKKSSWYNGPIYEDKELRVKMSKRL
jgi:serine/threonine protein kinase